MYFTKKDRKIQVQQKIIDRLEEENECLKEQLTSCNPKHVTDALSLAAKSREEYLGLIQELTHLKKEYLALICEMQKDKAQLKRDCRQGFLRRRY